MTISRGDKVEFTREAITILSSVDKPGTSRQRMQRDER